MIIYLILLIVIIISNFIIKDEKKKLYFYNFFFIVLTLLSCLRKYTVGADTAQFWDNFLKINSLNFSELFTLRYEKGFILLCKFIQIFSSSPQSLLIVTSIFVNFSVYKFIKKYSKNILFSCLLYLTLNYYFTFICLMRQALAISIVLYGFDYLINRKYFKYLIFVLLASQFHMSALIFLILIPICNFPNNKLILLTIILSFFSLVISKYGFLIITNLVPEYSKYVGSDYSQPSYISGGMYTLTNFCFLLFGFLIPNRLKIFNKIFKDREYVVVSIIISLATIISAASMSISIFNRIFLYFNFFNLIWVPNCLELIANDRVRRNWKILITFFTVLYVIVITYMGWYGVTPYLPFWR